ncbi:unnamed protein product [Malus baccata var. baccata]
MNYLLWNCRGLGSDTVVRALRGLIRKHRPSMIFLSETKMRDHRIDGIRRRLGYSFGFHVSPIGRAVGLSLWWIESMNVNILFSSAHIIDVCFCLEDSLSWVRCTFVYGTPYRREKLDFWNWMSNYFGPTDIPWLCGGDFNEFVWDHEKSGGASVLYNRPGYLHNFLNAAALVDLGFNGPKFTWRGMRYGNLVKERLDRAAANVLWQNLWPHTSVLHETAICSDHCPIVVLSQPAARRGKRLFCFEAFWAKEDDCRALVAKCWGSPGRGRWIDSWNLKLSICKSHLISWSRNKFNRRGLEIEELVQQLDSLQHHWEDNAKEIHVVSNCIDQLREQEELYWMQRSRDMDGSWVDDSRRVSALVEEHFKSLYTSVGCRDWGDILNCLEPLVSELMNTDLIKPVSEEEIKVAVHQMGGLKAPGPDGFQGIFYHSFWDIIVAEVNGLVMDFMQGVGNARSLNSTYIVLIPKVPHPESVSQYRPISLCNFSFKILSKVLANRLQPLLPLLISPMQNAFIADRQIQENLGLAHELFHFMKLRKSQQKFEMCVKLDMQKGYDRVEWDFLEAVLLKLGFCRGWTNLVMNCVRTVQFAILLNGQPGNWFSPSCGLRQGDSLSLYLFIMVSDVLSRSIQRGVEDGRLGGILMHPRGPCISHLFFADDTLICLQANLRNGKNIMHILNKYCLASGQMMNSHKSSVYFGRNTPDQVRSQLGSLLGMPVVSDPGVYLGLPAIWGRSKRSSLAFVKGRVMGKIQGWKQSALSFAGKEVLLKAVVQAIPTYPMNLFKFPAAICKDLDSMSAGFLWGDYGGQKRIHWVNWDTLGRPKSEGGLGFRNFQDFNDALLVKQCWRLMLNPNSLWAQTLKARYFPHYSFLDAKSKSWDIDFLRPFIPEVEINAILDIPLRHCSNRDRLVWTASRSGIYSVREGYHWIHSSRGQLGVPDSGVPSSLGTSVWKAIWQTNAPPKICHFLWRAAREALATVGGLFKRRKDSEFSQSLLSLAGTSAPLSRSRPSPIPAPRWSPPSAPYIKVNVDASWCQVDGIARLAAILRDHNGLFVAAHKWSLGAPSVVFAEALAMLKGCELAAELGCRWIVAESDSLEVVSSLQGDIARGSWEVFPILDSLLRLRNSFQGCRWSWVPRLANRLANFLASRSNVEMSGITWVRRPPSSMVHILNKDGLPCPP